MFTPKALSGFDARLKLSPNPNFNPENGLILSGSVAPYTTISSSNVVRNAPAVMTADFEGLDGSGGGLIAEFGGHINGAYCGFRADGMFIARCGDSSVTGPPFSGGKTAFVMAESGIVHGDGTLVVEFVPGTPIQARAWWNGAEITNSFEGSSGFSYWSGTDTGGYLLYSGSNPQTGEIVAHNATHVSASSLRYYANQIVGV